MLRTLRTKAGISQAELARRAKIPQGVLSYIENGRTKHPRIDTMQALAKALGCSLEELTKEEGQEDETGRAVS